MSLNLLKEKMQVTIFLMQFVMNVSDSVNKHKTEKAYYKHTYNNSTSCNAGLMNQAGIKIA